jgi:hypothetical protein
VVTQHKSLKLRVFETKVPRRIVGPKKELITGDLTKPNNHKLHNLSSLNIITVINTRRSAGHIT